jgi:hypothetical protein
MPINSNHVTGFAVGLGAAAVSFYLYKRNQAKVDQWLGSKGIHFPQSPAADPASMSIEDLMARKERLEDLIAEREMAASSGNGSPGTPK